MKSKLVFIFGLLASSVLAQEPFQPPIYVPGSGGGGGTPYNPAAVTITGGDVSNVSGTNDSWTTPSLFGVTTVYGTWAYVPAPMGALAVNTSNKLNTLTITAGTTGYPNVTLTFGSTPLISAQEFGARILNNTGTAVVITYPSAWSYNKGATATTFTIKPNSYVRINWDYDIATTTYFISGDPTAVAYRSITWSVYNSGSVLTSGQAHFLLTIPSASTIVGWEVFAYPSGSVAFDIYKATAGSTPSSTIFGSGTFPHVTSGTQSGRTAPTAGDTTAVAANDVFDMLVTGTPATATSASVILFYAPTL